MNEGFSINTKKVSEFFSQKKVINIIIISLFILLLIGSSWMRLQNLDLLKDSTTDEYIPLALDPFYFLRIAETISEQGSLPEFDNMRYLPAKLGFSDEILPHVVVAMHKVSGIFGDYSLQYINVISPVIFFMIGLILFFFLIYALTNSRMTALISSVFLAIIPSYIYRTTAGFSDHEAIGMAAFFAVLLVYTLGLKFLSKDNQDIKKILAFGLGTGFLTALTIASWGGIANFVFMIIPLSFFVFWVLKPNEINDNSIKKFFIFYILWFFSSIILSGIFGYNVIHMFERFTLSSSGLVSSFVMGFLFFEFLFIKLTERNVGFFKKYKNHRVLISISAVILAGIIVLFLVGNNPFSLISDISQRVFKPFGESRVGSTVAENSQNYLSGIIGQFGKIFFWLFFLGMFVLGIEISKGVKDKMHKISFIALWTIFISGYLFSKLSPDSILNGSNFVSTAFQIGGTLLFFGYAVWLYSKKKFTIKSEMAIIASWLLFMLISLRGGVRLIFVVTPFIVFMSGFFIVKTYDYWRKTKDDLFKVLLSIILIIVIAGMLISANAFVQTSSNQIKNSGPSATHQWQQAMEWVRDNTPERSIFIHWWDYGYWVQYLGKRPTVADGGQPGGGELNHFIGRYVLTTPNPYSALSFMKTQDVSYLLIDPTDLGKYPAYSKIGSDETGKDRLSQIPIMQLNPSQTRETAEGELRIYEGGVQVDEDMVYGEENNSIFLPSEKAIIAAVALEINEGLGVNSFSQPSGIFIYNQQQINIPIRYLNYKGEVVDFGGGIDATIKVIPKAQTSGQSINIDKFGAVIYLSPKVSKSLFAQLYLFDDVFENYNTLELVHSENDPLINSLNSQGAGINDFLYFNGFRGPIKIWEVDYPEETQERQEFLEKQHLEEENSWGKLDNLEFVK